MNAMSKLNSKTGESDSDLEDRMAKFEAAKHKWEAEMKVKMAGGCSAAESTRLKAEQEAKAKTMRPSLC